MPLSVLLVDDEDSFQDIFAVALQKSDLKGDLVCFGDGEDVIDYFSNRLSPTPSVVFVDVKVLRTTGCQVLEWRMKHPEFKSVPFIVFRSRDSERDKDRALQLGATCCFVKPLDIIALVEILNLIAPFLFGD